MFSKRAERCYHPRMVVRSQSDSAPPPWDFSTNKITKSLLWRLGWCHPQRSASEPGIVETKNSRSPEEIGIHPTALGAHPGCCMGTLSVNPLLKSSESHFPSLWTGSRRERNPVWVPSIAYTLGLAERVTVPLAQEFSTCESQPFREPMTLS